MLVMNVKERWRTATLGNVIEAKLSQEPIWVNLANNNESVGIITRKLSALVIDDYRSVEHIPTELTDKQLMTILFSASYQLINKSYNGGAFTKPDYVIIELAREFALVGKDSDDVTLNSQAKLLISVAKRWDKYINTLNQRRNMRFKA